MTKRVAIVQSSYIPWKGFFDLVGGVDEFILLDDVQYTRRDWRNRNRIKGPEGMLWLTIPVESRGRYNQRICDTRVSDPGWPQRHWKTIQQFYSRCAHFRDYANWLEDLYRGCDHEYLSEVNHRFLRSLCSVLGIQTKISWSMDYSADQKKEERILALCKLAGASVYVSGPSAASYLKEESFSRAGITLDWIDYSGYPEYRQRFPPFEHGVSVLDLILNEGRDARNYMKSFPTP